MIKFTEFIPQNVAFPVSKKIGVYDLAGKEIDSFPLYGLQFPDAGKKIYSFGALSDIHIGVDTSRDDFKAALSYLNDAVDFVCISGDLVHGGSDVALEQSIIYKDIVDNYATIPVYACAGNHDGAYVANVESVITSYTGQPLYYSLVQGDDVFIFVGDVSSSEGQLFTKAELQWLHEILEKYRNKRCFLFQHVRPDDSCGNALGIYTYDIWGGAEQTVFESLLKHYHNVIFFHGHSHLRFAMQKYDKKANYDNIWGCHSVHVPSLAVPRDTMSLVNPSIKNVYAASEGYIVDVYKTGIHLKGIDFVNGEWIPIASYWLDTTLKRIEANTFVDETGTITT